MEDLRAVLFDLDGVLLDSYEAWFRVMNAAARHFRKPDISPERFQAGWGQGIDADVREFFPGCSMQETQDYYEEHLLDHATQIRAEPGARDTFVRLRDAEVLRAVVTNTPVLLARDLLAWVGLIGLVDLTVGPTRGVRPKPAPDTLERACAEFEIRPQQTVLVGDSEFDAQAAAVARTHFIGYRFKAARSVQHLPEVADLVARAAR